MTNGELIELLNKMPLDAPAYIDDADTGWRLAIDEVELCEGEVLLKGYYGSPNNPRSR